MSAGFFFGKGQSDVFRALRTSCYIKKTLRNLWATHFLISVEDGMVCSVKCVKVQCPIFCGCPFGGPSKVLQFIKLDDKGFIFRKLRTIKYSRKPSGTGSYCVKSPHPILHPDLQVQPLKVNPGSSGTPLDAKIH